MLKGYIYSQQAEMFGGSREVIGFGSDAFHVREIARDLAYDVIERNHYSKKGDSVPHNKINLGVFVGGKLKGVLQFGYAMNPQSMDSVVEGTRIDEYLELNRMWIADEAGRNSESMAISYAVRYIRGKWKKIKWIQSFADERCGLFGIVYQAANFKYYGHHVAKFHEIDGEVFHNNIATNGKRRGKNKIQAKMDRAVTMDLRQFRYIYFIDQRCVKRCLLKCEPYPKHYKENQTLNC